MSVKIIRVAEGKESTLSHLYLDEIFLCYLLEDKIRESKIAGRTCIPEGDYKLKLNTAAGMNGRYKKAYPQIHQGMLEISKIPNFSAVFIHIGNYISDTAGCPLTGHYWNLEKGEYQVMQSAFAYQQIYGKLVQQLRAGHTRLEVRNRIRWFNTN